MYGTSYGKGVKYRSTAEKMRLWNSLDKNPIESSFKQKPSTDENKDPNTDYGINLEEISVSSPLSSAHTSDLNDDDAIQTTSISKASDSQVEECYSGILKEKPAYKSEPTVIVPYFQSITDECLTSSHSQLSDEFEVVPKLDAFSDDSFVDVSQSSKSKVSNRESVIELVKETEVLSDSSFVEISQSSTSKVSNRESVNEIRDELSRLSIATIDSNEDSISKLLECCNQDDFVDMKGVFKTCIIFNSRCPTMKIGEATYSDVYLIDDVQRPQAVKVIPLGGEDQLSFSAAFLETKSTQRAGNIKLKPYDPKTFHFIKLYSVSLVQGPYDSKLLALWDAFDDQNGSENTRPSKFKNNIADFPLTQQYLIMFLEFGGTDLEHTTLITKASRIRSVLLQTIIAVAQGEDQNYLEHRDLHWGNLLIENTNIKNIEYALGNNIISIASASIKVTIIDFTLSRSGEGDCVIYNDLSQDDELFAGKGNSHPQGDLQFDIYRWMKKEIGQDWSRYCSKSNVFWIYYLVDKLESFEISFLPEKELLEFKDALLGRYCSALEIVEGEILNPEGILFKYNLAK